MIHATRAQACRLTLLNAWIRCQYCGSDRWFTIDVRREQGMAWFHCNDCGKELPAALEGILVASVLEAPPVRHRPLGSTCRIALLPSG